MRDLNQYLQEQHGAARGSDDPVLKRHTVRALGLAVRALEPQAVDRAIELTEMAMELE